MGDSAVRSTIEDTATGVGGGVGVYMQAMITRCVLVRI
jgi:hypothetical protein